MSRFLRAIIALPVVFAVGFWSQAQAAPVAPAAQPEALPSTPTWPQLHRQKKIAALVADWFPGSHPDELVARVLQTYSRDHQGFPSKLELVSVYRDMPTKRDQSTRFAAEYGFKIAATPEEALTLGTGKLAVDGVFICTEWAPYPLSDTGQIMYPHRRLFEECVKVFKKSGRVVPVYIDKHLADTWQDSKWIYDTAKEMHIPLMAGSSVQLRLLDADATVEPGAELKEIVGISYGTLTSYGFHGLEMTQALAEQRKGGETGIKQVRCVTGPAVWAAVGKECDAQLFASAMKHVEARAPRAGRTWADMTPRPALFIVDYVDGLRVCVFTLEGAELGWAADWKYKDGRTSGTILANEARHTLIRFDWLMKGVEDMYLTGKPSWPVERTLMTSGTLDAALISKRDGGRVVETPYLQFSYTPDWSWRPPAEMMVTKTMPVPPPAPK